MGFHSDLYGYIIFINKYTALRLAYYRHAVYVETVFKIDIEREMSRAVVPNWVSTP